MVDYLTLVLEAAVTFGAVYAAYWLALRQDREREKREFTENRVAQLRLFKTDLERVMAAMQEQRLPLMEQVYGEAWDVAKFTGRLSTLTLSEYDTLSNVYVKLRKMNDQIANPTHVGISIDRLLISSYYAQLTTEIPSALNMLTVTINRLATEGST